ncbi:hypothetical protein S100390_v1c09890 [Spiroplasma sp. NBRC 100390]|uniref:hypothetical protein n=1 Tax=unclassified Spiroplasma TaxID=2637901 RepID=UPI0008928A1A|nr:MULTISPECIES: hypothetical protein [unclassified Spiroplasma]AOX44325.1 hypothetical protein STU14_v1c09890 [Spiroplasma sp. TU-14]APE13795.1 hypothetical protein S100390_v1c09890 [Spiroplasma sp. NBRC 100390]
MENNRAKTAHDEAREIVGRYRMLGEDIYAYLEVLKHQISQRKKSNEPNDLEQAAYFEDLLTSVKKVWNEKYED